MPAATTSVGSTATAPPLGLSGLARREARLRPEFAHHYPGLVPRRWEPAATLADRVLAGRLLGGRDLVHPGRSLVDVHFEFRGGGERDARGLSRPRREDR